MSGRVEGRRWARAVAAVVLALGAPALVLSAQTASDSAAPHATSPSTEPSEARRIAMMAMGTVSASVWTQVIGMPEQWPRTWQGYGNRLSDQVGFLATEEVLRLTLEATVPWHSTPRPCPGARGGRSAWRRVGAAASCGLSGTFVAHNRAGERRPNLPLIGAIVAASAVSLSWRPERGDAQKGQVFLLTRVGISLGATSINRAVGAWRGR